MPHIDKRLSALEQQRPAPDGRTFVCDIGSEQPRYWIDGTMGGVCSSLWAVRGRCERPWGVSTVECASLKPSYGLRVPITYL